MVVTRSPPGQRVMQYSGTVSRSRGWGYLNIIRVRIALRTHIFNFVRFLYKAKLNKKGLNRPKNM